MTTRERLISVLLSALEREESCRAAWLGGSDANGRTDTLSDIDAQVIVRDGSVESMFGVVESALSGISPIARRYRVLEPSWHGHSQCFYALRECPPELLIDFTVMKLGSSPGSRMLESERHGRPLVLFDKDSLLAAVPLDRAAHEARIRVRVAELQDRVPLLAPLVLKAVKRGNVPEAASMYHNLVLRGVVDLLRIVHCPDRFDFGLRYIRADLPPEAAAAVERLSLPGSLEQVATSVLEGLELFERTLPEACKRWGPEVR